VEARDIADRSDIVKLVDAFYAKVKADELLAPVFSHLDWKQHMPIMYNFWSTMLLGEISYKGNPFEKHMHLDIQQKHFSQWLSLFQETVDEHFEGAKAAEIKDRACSIAGIFQHKLGL
jgi:hemoglobin